MTLPSQNGAGRVLYDMTDSGQPPSNVSDGGRPSVMGVNRSVLWSCVLLLVVGVGALLSKQQFGSSDEVVARVGDREITLGEVEKQWREIDVGSFLQVSQSRYDALVLYLDMVVGNQILEMEAANRGLTPETLLRQELSSRLTPITDADVERFYNNLGEQQTQGRTLEQLREPINNFLQQQQSVEVRATLIAELSDSLNVRVERLLEPPRMAIARAPTDPIKGTSSAIVEIIEFSDFQ
ncbi:MAG: hypothetical protein VX992_00690 [Acidobacteriota bacterium]|nr:hypothetical protein [Acidobacteriota bacterium]